MGISLPLVTVNAPHLNSLAAWVNKHREQLIVFNAFEDTLGDLVERLEAVGYTMTQIRGGMIVRAQCASQLHAEVYLPAAAQALSHRQPTHPG